jgi:hypothetical protein
MAEGKYGFVYLWYDRKHKRYYVGCHWGSTDDGYTCSSNWLRDAMKRRPEDFKRRILTSGLTRNDMYDEEQRYLDMIKPSEIKPVCSQPRYYNLCLSSKDPWHRHEDSRKTIGAKISAAKRGKKIGPMSEERKANISKAKLAKKRVASEETRQRMSAAKKGVPIHTQEWKDTNAARMKEVWASGARPRKQPKNSMSREDQDRLCSEQLKSRWADPIWAANQRQKLKDSWARRKA